MREFETNQSQSRNHLFSSSLILNDSLSRMIPIANVIRYPSELFSEGFHFVAGVGKSAITMAPGKLRNRERHFEKSGKETAARFRVGRQFHQAQSYVVFAQMTE